VATTEDPEEMAMNETTTKTKQNSGKRNDRNYEWVLEVVLLVTIAPALIFGVNALKGIPIA
jgi:hypothetical protein